jgi:hypothetical protein
LLQAYLIVISALPTDHRSSQVIGAGDSEEEPWNVGLFADIPVAVANNRTKCTIFVSSFALPTSVFK